MANPLYAVPWLKDNIAKFAKYCQTSSWLGTIPVNPYNGLVTSLPSDAYKVVNIDEISDADNYYYGYVTPDTGIITTSFAGWFVMKATLVSGTWAAGEVSYSFATWDNGTGSAVGVNGVQYRTAVTGAWANRANLTYTNYESVF